MKDIRLDIGCGGRGTMYPDFIGVDIHPAPTDPRKPGAEYLQLDFVYSAALPWKPGTVAELVAFHIIEHLEYQEGQTLLRRAWDLLRPGAKMFITCPDLDFFIQKYIEQDAVFWQRKYPSGKEMWPGNTIAGRFNYHFCGGPGISPHKYQYNQESLIDAARRAGCRNVEPMPIKHLGYPEDHFWSRRPDHEVGIICTKD